MALPVPRAASRYANQVLAIQQAIALLRMGDLRPYVAHEARTHALHILEAVAYPLRNVPSPRRHNRPGRRPQLTFTPVDQVIDDQLQRRIADGFTPEAAQLHLDWGMRLSPDGVDYAADVA